MHVLETFDPLEVNSAGEQKARTENEMIDMVVRPIVGSTSEQLNQNVNAEGAPAAEPVESSDTDYEAVLGLNNINYVAATLKAWSHCPGIVK